MARAKRKATAPPITRWFIGASRDPDHPRCGWWEYWDGQTWAPRFEDALLFADADECANVAEKVERDTGVRCGIHAAGPERGECFLVMGAGKWWSGSAWVDRWEDARQWTADPAVGANMVRCPDPWQGCHDECERIRAEQGVSCAPTFIPRAKWVERIQERHRAARRQT